MSRSERDHFGPPEKGEARNTLRLSLSDRIRLARFAYDFPYILFDRTRTLLGRLAGSHPIRCDYDDERTQPFFIVGSGRSGNTLLRAILMGHETVVIPPESYVLGHLVRNYRTQSHLPWPRLVRHVFSNFEFHPEFETWNLDLAPVFRECSSWPEEKRSLAGLVSAVYTAYRDEHFPGATRWGDKTPINAFHLPRISSLFPGAPYIHVLRDGRDVVSSYLAAGLEGEVEAACRRWRDSVFLVRRFARRLPEDRFLEVRYERLVREPAKVIRSVCAFLGLEYSVSILQHQERVEKLGDTDRRHHSGLRRPITDESVGKWRHRLDAHGREEVERLLGSHVRRLGYK